MLSSVKWGKFSIDDLFEKIETNDVSKNTDGDLPGTTAVLSNNQIGKFVSSDNATILQNVISCTANGFGKCFYQPYAFTVVQDSYAIKLKNNNISLDKIKYFIIPCLNRVISQFNWSNKSGWNKLKNNKIALPVKENKIDYKFMQEFSAELEAQKIAELEAQKIAELEAYIKVTGITDFDLNNQEQDMLDNINNLDYGEFLVSDLFSIETLVGLNKDKVTVGNEYDYITRTSKNQGISLSTSFINGSQALNNANTWSLGLLQLNFFFRNKPWYGGETIFPFYLPRSVGNLILLMIDSQ